MVCLSPMSVRSRKGTPGATATVVETVEGDRLLPTLDLADELSAESGSLAESLLAERALFAQRTETRPEDFSDAFGGAPRHGTERHPGARGSRAVPRQN